MSNAALTLGVHHIGLTVPNLGETRTFFLDTLGFIQLGEIPDYPAVFLSDGTTMITLWQANKPNAAVAFDRKNVIGLHHFALKVDGVDALAALHDKLKVTNDVEIEFAPEPLLAGPTMHMMCAIPGGIRMEFVAARDS